MKYHIDQENFLYIHSNKYNLIFIGKNRNWIRREYDHNGDEISYDDSFNNV